MTSSLILKLSCDIKVITVGSEVVSVTATGASEGAAGVGTQAAKINKNVLK